ncbi:hypothetical protein D3C87_1959350 [compost metagenome]
MGHVAGKDWLKLIFMRRDERHGILIIGSVAGMGVYKYFRLPDIEDFLERV